MDTYSLEAEDFIQEVSKHPAIWDLTSEDNKCAVTKEKAWADVARLFINNFDAMTATKKLQVFRKLHSKWRNLRDNYVRSLRRKNTGQRGYVYAKYFSFLDPVYLNRQPRKDNGHVLLTEANQESGSNDEIDVIVEGGTSDSKRKISAVNIKTESSSDEEPSVIENFKRRRRERSPEFLEVKNEGEFDVSTSCEPDEDKLFFDSLLPVVRQFDLDEKLELRTRILQLIKKIRSGSIVFNNVYE